MDSWWQNVWQNEHGDGKSPENEPNVMATALKIEYCKCNINMYLGRWSTPVNGLCQAKCNRGWTLPIAIQVY